jgi:molybdate transport system substrate-binding protein
MTYAIGKLVLWSRDQRADTGEAALRGAFTKLAIANPAAAPYGGAALDVLQRLGLMGQLQARLVQGTSIAQTFQFVETGNAELGFIALSQLDGRMDGGRWIVPQSLYEPLLQDGIVTKQGERNQAARDFLAFLTTPAARNIITRFGYEVQP